MSVAQVNLVGIELSERLDEAGFRHRAAMVGERLGARRIGASVYEAEAGLPIWPYHYHHGIEEWLYVIAGAPVLREPAGERALSPGDLVCFPTGPAGAHTLYGPGRFVIFATGQHVEPWLSVYPDSDKVSGPEGILLRSSAVGYWHGEGTAGPQPADPAAPDAGKPTPRPIVNLLELGRERPEIRARTTELGPLVHAERLDGTLVELDPLEEPEPYHYVHGREDWLLVLVGKPTMSARRSRALPQCRPYPGVVNGRMLIPAPSAPARASELAETSCRSSPRATGAGRSRCGGRQRRGLGGAPALRR